MKTAIVIVVMLTGTALADPLPQLKPPGPGGFLRARLHVVGFVLCADGRRQRCGCQAARGHVSERVAREWIVLFAQRPATLMAAKQIREGGQTV
jgi:hypothetical protein